ncbi:ATP synthase complex assembly protein atp12 [Chytriomyces hyalinus]|nr:ATP synthase complex assembly protein atp12 [Chytriomyces hyalinus]
MLRRSLPLLRRYSTTAASPSAKPTAVSRFWKKSLPSQSADGFRIKLDGRTLKNPDGAEIVIPTQNPILANLVAAEWEEMDKLIKAGSLPMTSISVRGIELAGAPETREGVITNLFRYLDTDSILYMQDGSEDGTEGILELQEKYWTSIINWVSAEFQVPITPTYGISSVTQTPEAISKLRQFVEALSPIHLAAFERAVLSSKSFLISTALLKRGISVDFAVAAARVEVDFQVMKWGEVLDAHDVDYHALRRDLGSISLAVFAASLLHSVSAFDGTSPFIIAQGGATRGSTLKQTNQFNDAIETIPCASVTLILDQPKVHASDLGRFSDSYSAVKGMMSDASSITIPYARVTDGVQSVLSKLSEKCNANDATTVLSASDISIASADSPRVFVSRLASLTGSMEHQQLAASENSKIMSDLITKLESLATDYVVVFTSSNSASQSLAKRSDVAETGLTARAGNTTFIPFKNRNFLQKYVLFNTGLFEGAIALFLVVSVSLLGVNILVSVQTPTKFEQHAKK